MTIVLNPLMTGGDNCEMYHGLHLSQACRFQHVDSFPLHRMLDSNRKAASCSSVPRCQLHDVSSTIRLSVGLDVLWYCRRSKPVFYGQVFRKINRLLSYNVQFPIREHDSNTGSARQAVATVFSPECSQRICRCRNSC